MRLSYTESIVLAPDDGEPIAMFRPEVGIHVIHGNRSASYTALLDTGADHIVFPSSVADELGIEVEPALGPASQTVRGDRLTLDYADVKLAIDHDKSRLEWPTRVYFNHSDHHKDFLLLGQMGFLEFFTVTFIGGEFAFELHPNEFLPSNSE
jgi:hypothetical protein